MPSRGPPLERLLRRERWISAGALSLLCALAWLYLITGAGLNMPLADMTQVALFPHTLMEGSPSATSGFSWSPWYALLMVLMWWVMMIAMMTPSAAPMVLLHARVARYGKAAGSNPGAGLRHTAVFVGGYLLVWLGFSVLATALQGGLEAQGLISRMKMWSLSGSLSATVLIVAGIDQWTSVKNQCLRHCRAPAQFLTRHWRPGRAGALRLGVLHGGYCVGCCWALMALLFVGGVMNAVWILALTAAVVMEKAAPQGLALARLTGTLFIVWGMATLWV